MPFVYNPPDGLRNTTSFPTKPANETEFRNDFQNLFDQVSTYINTSLSPTTADLTYYVDPDSGSDSNDGLSPATALITIQAAIDKIPQTVNHHMHIVVSPSFGVSEYVSIYGRIGNGSITINGGAIVSDSYPILGMIITQCDILITVVGMKGFTTAADTFMVNRCAQVIFDFCKAADSAPSFSGFHIFASMVTITNSFVANKGGGISARDCSTVFSGTNSGGGNVNALYADSASTIGKSNTQPVGTNNESTASGGVIR